MENIVFYDSKCGLCNRFIQFLVSRDHQKKLYFAPLKGKTYQRLKIAEKIKKKENEKKNKFFKIVDNIEIDTVVYYKKGEIYCYSNAAISILFDLGGPWRLTRLLRLCPRFILDFFYRIIAKIRYCIFGKASCKITNVSIPTIKNQSKNLLD